MTTLYIHAPIGGATLSTAESFPERKSLGLIKTSLFKSLNLCDTPREIMNGISRPTDLPPVTQDDYDDLVEHHVPQIFDDHMHTIHKRFHLRMGNK